MSSYKSKVSFNKVFLRFICVSFLLHIIYMLLFEIEIERTRSEKHSYQLIFLGSFLKEFDVKGTTLREQFLSQAASLDIIEKIMSSYPKAIFINPVMIRQPIGKMEKLVGKVLPTPKPMLKIDEFILSVPEFLSSRRFRLGGDIVNREVLYQPEFLNYKSRKITSGLSVIKFEVCVLPDGRVLSVKNLISVGDPVSDRYLASKIKNWIFTPLSQMENSELNRGIVKIILND